MPYRNKGDNGAQHRRSRQRKVRYVSCYKARHGCIICGENEPLYLDLDHTNPATKSMAVSDMIVKNVSWRRLLAELEKCEVLCKKHHLEKTLRNKDHLASSNRESEEPDETQIPLFS